MSAGETNEPIRVTCTRRVQFCAGHRVLGHEGKCANMHGHNYVVLFTAEAPELDSVGRVIDFSVLKEMLGGWIEREWDHGFLYCEEDESFDSLFAGLFIKHKHFRCSFNPTAENMAEFLLGLGNELLKPNGINITQVTVWETENCYATAQVTNHT